MEPWWVRRYGRRCRCAGCRERDTQPPPPPPPPPAVSVRTLLGSEYPQPPEER